MPRLKSWILLLLVILASACRDKAEEEPPPSEPQATPTIVNASAGCETGELETWLEAVLPNAQAFRNESFSVMALPPDQVSPIIARLSDLRDGMNVSAIPDCVASTQLLLTDMMGIMMTQLVGYSEGKIDQPTLISEVTTQQGRYDGEIQPALDGLIQELEAQYQQGQ